MPSGRSNKALLLFMEDDELDQNLNLLSKTKPSQPVFKKKEPKGKRLNQRKVKLNLEESDEEGDEDEIKFLSIQKSKLRTPHQFINKRTAIKSSTDKVITNSNENNDDKNNNIKYTKEYLENLKNEQTAPEDELMDLDQPVIVHTAPVTEVLTIHNSAPIDDDEGEDYNIIPVDEYESEDNRNDLIKGGANNFPADDDLMPDSTDAFVDDGPLTLSKSKFSQSIDIDEDLYDMELPMVNEDSEIETSVSEPVKNEIIEPESLADHLQNLKKSIEKLNIEREATEAKREEIREKLDHIGQSKEQLLIDLNL